MLWSKISKDKKNKKINNQIQNQIKFMKFDSFKMQFILAHIFTDAHKSDF